MWSVAMKTTGLNLQTSVLYYTVTHSWFLAHALRVHPAPIQALPLLSGLPGGCFLSTPANFIVRLCPGPNVGRHRSACRATRPWRCPTNSVKNQSTETASLFLRFPLLSPNPDWFVRLDIYMAVLAVVLHARDRFFCSKKGQEDT